MIIRTRFGEVAAADWFLELSLEDMSGNRDWRKAAGIDGGPFCYVDAECGIPF